MTHTMTFGTLNRYLKPRFVPPCQIIEQFAQNDASSIGLCLRSFKEVITVAAHKDGVGFASLELLKQCSGRGIWPRENNLAACFPYAQLGD